MHFYFLTFIYTIRKDRPVLRLQNSLSSTNSHNRYSYLNDFPSQVKQFIALPRQTDPNVRPRILQAEP